jgi:hypothetical protein
MSDDLLLELMAAGGERWRRLVAKAIAARLRRAIAGPDEAFEDHAGPIEDCLLDAASAFRALRASRGGRGDKREAAAEAGESLTRLMEQLATVRCEALAAARSAEH